MKTPKTDRLSGPVHPVIFLTSSKRGESMSFFFRVGYGITVWTNMLDPR